MGFTAFGGPKPDVAERRHCHVIYVGESPNVNVYIEVFTFGPSPRRLGPFAADDTNKKLSQQQCDQDRATHVRYGDKLPFTD